MINNWKLFFKEKHAVQRLVITFVLLVLTVFSLSRFIIFVESRQGVILKDPLFDFFEAFELNVIIFTLIYVSIIASLFHLSAHPSRLVVALQSYTLLVVIRILMMYVTPLDPPLGTIDLIDPLVFVVGTGTKITKDLFFSGHTSTLFLLFLVVVNKKLRSVFLVSSLLVGIAVMLQKAHYTIDVLVAPFISYSCFRIVLIINKKLKYINDEKPG